MKANETYTVTFVVVPKVVGITRAYPAVVKYSTEEEKQITSFSTFKSVRVARYDKKTAARVSQNFLSFLE